MSTEIRDATRADVDEILRFLSGAAATPGVRDSKERLAGVVEADHAWLLVAVDGATVVGCIIAGWDGWRASLYRLAVAPERRRAGIARMLVEEAEKRLRGAGAPRISALVIRTEEHAEAFWRGIGYEEDTRIKRFIRDLS